MADIVVSLKYYHTVASTVGATWKTQLIVSS